MPKLNAETVGWSASPEVTKHLAYQKAVADEYLAGIRAGQYTESYFFIFGHLESMFAYIRPVGIKTWKKEGVAEADEFRKVLYELLIQFNELSQQNETLDILVNERTRQLRILKGQITGAFWDFYSKIIELGVNTGLFSFNKGGGFSPTQEEKGIGVPFMMNGARLPDD